MCIGRTLGVLWVYSVDVCWRAPIIGHIVCDIVNNRLYGWAYDEFWRDEVRLGIQLDDISQSFGDNIVGHLLCI